MPKWAASRVRAKLLAFASLITFGAGEALAESPPVRLASGFVAGQTLEEVGVRVYKGIPYAAPPTGGLRWKPPRPVRAWSGVRTALEAGSACMQPNAGPKGFYTDPPSRMSEDCLYLNVWAPVGVRDAPVMVFIHGGALVTGEAGSPRYDGAKLARKGVVVVTINYRLGVFGFFAHPELSAESPHRASGNYGTLDQIAALQWVRDNAAAFGGDPQHVTLFGQSAGAHSIYLLMASPLAKGLFQGAIAQSGYLPAMPEIRRERFGLAAAEAGGLEVSRRLGAPHAEDLRAIPAEVLLQSAADNPNSSMGATSSPIVDGWVQRGQLFETFEAGHEAPVPLITGFTSGEPRSFDPGATPPFPKTPQDFESRVRAAYGPAAGAFLRLYPASAVRDSSLAALRDANFGWSVERLLDLHTRRGAKGYLYYFDHVYAGAAARDLGAFHSSDIPFVLGNVGPGAITPRNWPSPPAEPDDLAMSEALMDYWVAFARLGAPAPKGRPAWPAFTSPSGGYMAFRQGRALPSSDLLPGMFALQDAHMRRLRALDQAWTWANTGVWAQPAAAPPAN